MPSASSRSAIIAELEQTRAEFHNLLAAIPADAWSQTSRNPSWTVAQIMVHIVQVGANVPPEANWLRHGRWFPKPPVRLFDVVNRWVVRWLARGKTPAAVAADYEQVHHKLLALVHSLTDDDWSKSATYPVVADGPAGPDGVVTLDMLVRYHTRHFHLHVPDITPVVVMSEQPVDLD